MVSGRLQRSKKWTLYGAIFGLTFGAANISGFFGSSDINLTNAGISGIVGYLVGTTAAGAVMFLIVAQIANVLVKD